MLSFKPFNDAKETGTNDAASDSYCLLLPLPSGNNNIILSYTNYMDLKFCSSITYENIIGVQFHPEKSGLIGLKFLKNLFG